MDDAVRQAKDFAIARISRSPGFRELVELLDELAQRFRDEAFHSNESDLRTLDRAKGATQLVEQFKTQIARVAQETQLG